MRKFCIWRLYAANCCNGSSFSSFVNAVNIKLQICAAGQLSAKSADSFFKPRKNRQNA